MAPGTGIVVVGAGSWGTALARQLAGREAHVQLWAREPEVVAGINDRHENPRFLAGWELPVHLSATGDLEAALAGGGVVVSAVPTQFVRSVFAPVAPALKGAELVVSVSKGLELDTLLRPTQALSQLAEPGIELVALSGPSFAREVAAGHPTAVVAASTSAGAARRAQRLFSDDTMRVYTSDDVVGVELGGALKNVIAIAAGICEGMGLGRNSLAALITRGLAEITRLGVACGGHPLTFAGLSGMGDLVLTCTGAQSRNHLVGMELGRGRTLADILDSLDEVAEGVKTTAAARRLADDAGVEMPITEQVYRVLYEDETPAAAVQRLMGRELRRERDQ